MKVNSNLLLVFLLCLCGKIFGQADPGSSGISFNKTVFQKNETGTLQVSIGNYSAALTAGTALTPYDATFTITIPFTFSINGPVDLSGVLFNVIIINEMKTASGSTIIAFTVPKGIPKGGTGTIIIPIVASEKFGSILYASVKTESNLTNPPSGNATPNNDLQFAPAFVEAALPVILVSFKASKENTTVHLDWSTAQETNNDHFDIERSLNGINWNSIGIINSSGESRMKKDYSFIDKNPVSNINYYRLKMIDQDQTFAYSKISRITFENTQVKVYPNPVAEMLKIDTGDWSNVSNIQLLDMSGTAVYNSGDFPLHQIDIRNLSSGNHILRIQKADGSAVVQRIMVTTGR